MQVVSQPPAKAADSITRTGDAGVVAASASVIIVNYNGAEKIEACLRSILREGRPATEIIVVDNQSTDGSAELIEARLPTVRLIRSARNGGFGYGCNLAAQHATGEYLVFLNPDTEVRPGWIDGLIGSLERHPEAGMTTSRILLTRTPDRLNAAGNELHPTGLSLCRGVGQPHGRYPQDEEIGLISGAAFAMRRALFQTLGGFDEAYFLYVEDTDLSVRVRLAGYTIRYVPASEVLHDYELRFGPNKTYHLERNRYRLLLKAYRWRTLAALLPSLALAEALTWGYVLLLQRQRAQEKLRAYRWVAASWDEIMAARRQTQQQRRVPDRAILGVCVPDLDFGQVGTSPAATLAARICNPIFRVLLGATRAVVRW
ncbi:MAG: glycosyltransferase family 2 protein [Chloroflexi bacterium]|nr:glycosyltransferase family 2 protein [Chloroflexota bacterium]